MSTIELGNLTVQPLYDGFCIYENPANFFPEASLDQLEEHLPSLVNVDGKFEFVIGAFVVRTKDRIFLVDAGIGPRQIVNREHGVLLQGGALLRSLAEYGLTPTDITDVLLSHLHADHIGWVYHHGEVTFPRATYRFHVNDWNYFMEGDGRAQMDLALEPSAEFPPDYGTQLQMIEGISSQLEMWDQDGPLAYGIDVMCSPGHTPGSSVFILSSGDSRALLIGDVAHCPIEFTADEWAHLTDVDRQLAKDSRDKIAQMTEDQDILIGAPHFPELKFGRLITTTTQRRFITL